MTDRQRSLTYKTASGMMWTAWGSGGTAVLKVVVLVLLTRLLSPADFGLASAAMVVISFSLTFSLLGMGPALVQRTSLEPRHISTAFVVSTLLGLLVATVVWILAPVIAGFFRMPQLVPIVRALSFMFPITGISVVADNLLQRELRFRFLANRGVLAYGLGYGLVGVVLALMGWGVWALVIAQLVQALLRTIFVLRVVPPVLRPRPSWKCFRELMDYGAGQSAARIGAQVANQIDNMVVGRWLGAVALGVYGRAYQLMSVPTTLLGEMLDRVLFPTMARVQDDRRRLTSAYLQGTVIVGLVTLPAGVVAAVLAPELVTVAFGSRWEALVAPFRVLALGMVFRTSYLMSDSVSRATGRVYRRAWRQALYAVLVFLGALIGQRFGVTGVAIGVLVALVVNYLLMAQLGLSVAHISWGRFFEAQLPAVVVAVVAGGGAFGISAGTRHLGLPPVVGLAAGALGAVGSAAAMIRWFPAHALGQHGMRIRDTLTPILLDRLRSAGVRGTT